MGRGGARDGLNGSELGKEGSAGLTATPRHGGGFLGVVAAAPFIGIIAIIAVPVSQEAAGRTPPSQWAFLLAASVLVLVCRSDLHD